MKAAKYLIECFFLVAALWLVLGLMLADFNPSTWPSPARFVAAGWVIGAAWRAMEKQES